MREVAKPSRYEGLLVMCLALLPLSSMFWLTRWFYLSWLRLHSYQKHTGCLWRGRIEAERGWGRWMRLGCMKQSNLSPHSPRANWWACCSSPSGLSFLPRAASWRKMARRYCLAVRKTHSCSSAGPRWNPSGLDDPQHARLLPASRKCSHAMRTSCNVYRTHATQESLPSRIGYRWRTHSTSCLTLLVFGRW